jgi:uncharacterized protein DUF6580
MISNSSSKSQNVLGVDLLLVAFLIGFDVLARIMVHVPNFSPLLASALFAGTMLRVRPLALIVPIAAMLLSNLVLGLDDWRIAAVVYLSLALPAVVGIFARRYRISRMLVPAVLSCSLIFFVTTNFAVWAFGGIYTADLQGLIQCYVAALPFLQYTMSGDLVWAVILFGGAWLVQTTFARTRLRNNAV